MGCIGISKLLGTPTASNIIAQGKTLGNLINADERNINRKRRLI